MSFDGTRTALEEYFSTQWALGPNTPIAWQNISYENNAESWVRFSLVYANSQNMALGGNVVNTPGFISVQVFTKPDTGIGKAYRLADAITGILQNKTIGSNIFTYATSVEVIGDAIRKINKIEYGEYQLNVKTRFDAI